MGHSPALHSKKVCGDSAGVSAEKSSEMEWGVGKRRGETGWGAIGERAGRSGRWNGGAVPLCPPKCLDVVQMCVR